MSSSNFGGAVSRAALGALVVVVVAAGFAGWKYWNQLPTKPDADEGRAVAVDFIGRIHSGRAAEAWDSTTAEFKSLEGRESFVRSVKKQPLWKEQLQFVSMQEIQVKNEPRSEYIFQSGGGKMVRILVGYDGGTWKVDRLTL